MASRREIANYACAPLLGNESSYLQCSKDVYDYTRLVQSPSGVYLVNAVAGYTVRFDVDGQTYFVEAGKRKQLASAPGGSIVAHIAGQKTLSLSPIRVTTHGARVADGSGFFLQSFSNGVWTQYVVGQEPGQPSYPSYPSQPSYPSYPYPYQPYQSGSATCDSVGSTPAMTWCAGRYADGSLVADRFPSPAACMQFVASCAGTPANQGINPSWTQTDDPSASL